MPPGVPNIRLVHQSFEDKIAYAQNLFNYLSSITTNRIISQKQIDDLTCYAFLISFASWEEFIQNSFLRFMRGASTINGTAINRIQIPLPHNLAEAHHQLLDYTGRQRVGWISWTYPGKILQIANHYFLSGAPYDQPIISAALDIDRFRIIRHHIAHRSNGTKSAFINVLSAIRIYNNRYTVGKLLRTVPPVHANAGVTNYFNYMQNILTTTARNIAF